MRNYNNLLGLILLALSVLEVVHARPVEEEEEQNQQGQLEEETNKASDPLGYLHQFGYLSPITFRSMGGENGNAEDLLASPSPELREAISDFQDFAGLDVTGELDGQTLDKMSQSRCGVVDKRQGQQHRSKRYVLQSSRWPKMDLQYKIGSYPRSHDAPSSVDAEIARAFALWSASSPLTFSSSPSASSADILLDFYRGDHGDGNSFDGQGGVLAHAFFPGFGGSVHFDDAEDWMDSGSGRGGGGKQLLQTALHEIGHSLGLEHSKDQTSVMAPFYKGWEAEVALTDDDVRGIQTLYGKPERKTSTVTSTFSTTTTTVTTTTVSTTTSEPFFSDDDKDLCLNTKFDAVAETATGDFYVFREQSYWRLSPDRAGTDDGPRPISDWSGLQSSGSGGVDAAFLNPNDQMTYLFFQDGQVGQYSSDLSLQPGYPRPVGEQFPGAPDGKMDAVLLWGRNKELYFFQGSLYWKYSFEKGRVEDNYPRFISKGWSGVPDYLDSAVLWKNGRSYFFKGSDYYRFDDDAVEVERLKTSSYPRTIGKWWLGCNSDPLTEEAGSEREPRWAWSD